MVNMDRAKRKLLLCFVIMTQAKGKIIMRFCVNVSVSCNSRSEALKDAIA